MRKLKLSVVIHAEEEFDWDGGFFRSNTRVNHGSELIELVDEIIKVGGKVTLAMDYPFVTSDDGKKVIQHFKPLQGSKIEFATHLHPWVNPPFEHDQNEVTNRYSFPGNLARDMEFNKIRVLTEKIEEETGTRPVTYLAGRYGIGTNSAEILKELGYKVDLSISAYSNFSHVQGPNFVDYTNQIHTKDGLTYIPHTCSMGAISKRLEKHLNLTPSTIGFIQRNKTYPLIARMLRIRKYRLSPEGFSYPLMKAMTESQMSIGQNEFVVSFHSPSVKVGGTPYVRTEKDLDNFKQALFQYVDWFNSISGSSVFLPSRVCDNDKIKNFF
ncbi:hypothetical protein [Vibrio sp. DNB22_19_1]